MSETAREAALEKENRDLKDQAERLVSTIEIHHRNFDEMHERAKAEPGEFAAWIAGMNDISADVTTLFRILQRHYQQFLDTLKWQLASRAEFERLMHVDPDTLTDLERSARFLYLQKLAFGGKVTGRNFGVTTTGPARFDLTKLVPMLEAVHDRLAPVIIERLPFEKLIPRYDRPGALFYCDPPYVDGEEDYGKGVFSPADFARLRDLLEAVEGRFILSINDRPEIRELFAASTIEPVELSYRVSGGVTPARELIITGGKGVG